MATWGQTTALGAAAAANQNRGMAGTYSVANQELVSVSMYLSNTSDIRIAVYQGGSLSAGPQGATLVWDGGIMSSSGGTPKWYTNTHPGPYPALTNGAVTWIMYKSNNNANNWYYSASSADAGDFQTANGRWDSSESNDETIAYPSTWPSDSGTFGNFWYSVYITTQTASAAGLDYMWRRRWC